MSLSGKIALVTGGTGALGSVITKRLSDEGAYVFATYRSEKELAQFPNALKKKITIIKADVTDEGQVAELYSSILANRRRIDIVVNTVGGYLPQKNITVVSLQEWDSMMNINLKSAFLSTREALKAMKGQPYGRIINISAMVGLNPSPGRAPYAISKAGVSLLTEIVAQEQKGTGITVNAIAPSIIATAANKASMPDADQSKWIKPEDIAETITFLCSEAGAAITGTTLKAYGGL